MSELDEPRKTSPADGEEAPAERHRGRTILLRLLYLAAIAAIVASFFWQIAHGDCPVP